MTSQKEQYSGCEYSRKNPENCFRDFCVHEQRKEWNSGYCDGADRCPEYEEHNDEPETTRKELIYPITETQLEIIETMCEHGYENIFKRVRSHTLITPQYNIDPILADIELVIGILKTAEETPTAEVLERCVADIRRFRSCIPYTGAQTQQPTDLTHISPERRGCLTCLDPECLVWQTADQNCWKPQSQDAPAPEQEQICNHNYAWHGKCYIHPGFWKWINQCTKCGDIQIDTDNPLCSSPHDYRKGWNAALEAAILLINKNCFELEGKRLKITPLLLIQEIAELRKVKQE